ncbi:MAG: alcohol dehydrogenase catalytic domain-containing protein [Silicimonas sp.]|nr:alcohol dehydrogenase catalytic domain-containing protein [Silicimonas sp.]
MKALVYTGPEELIYQDFADPDPQPGDALIRIERVGICGSDMHSYLGHDPRRVPPMILGHEACGVTADGRRVTINPMVTCGTCPACVAGRENICRERSIMSILPRQGSFAEAAVMREENLIVVPDGVDPAKASLAEPLACGWHAVRLGLEAGWVEAPKTLVIGGGPIGLGAALSAAAMGITDITVTEPNEMRRRFLMDRCGLKVLAELDAPDSYDLVIDGVGFTATRETASSAAVPGGVIMHIGLGGGEPGLDVRRFTLQEVTFIGTYTYTYKDFRDTAAAIFDGRLGPLDWIEERPLSEGHRAFQDIRAGKVAAPKIVLVP